MIIVFDDRETGIGSVLGFPSPRVVGVEHRDLRSAGNDAGDTLLAKCVGKE
jgi:hypothetical protein